MVKQNFARIKVFDTTLRDGEQSPGATLTHQEKILIAHQLAKLKVDIIEAGFPIASVDDFNAVKEIAATVKGPTIAGLSRAINKDIDECWKAVQNAKKPRIHTFMSSSDIHLKYQFKISRKEALEKAVNAVKHAVSLCDDVEFSPMDATRSDEKFLLEMIEKTIEAGAKTINVPDTVGYTQPFEFGKLIKKIKENVKGIDDVVISVHCHNDLGLAVANSLEAIRNGARQVECTVNGIGERAGNASVEEIAMNLETRKNFFKAITFLDLREIYKTSQMVSSFTGIVVQPNKAIVGENAFAHESGIHQQGILSNAQTYEIMNPKMIGKESTLVLGKHSGKHAIKAELEKMGYSLSESQLLEIVSKIKALADKQKKVFKEDVVAIANDVTRQLSNAVQRIKLEEVKIITGNKTKPFAEVKVFVDGIEKSAKSEGVGPVDAVSKAINSIFPSNLKLKEYNLKAITGGTDALADVIVRIEDNNGKVFTAEAIDEDILMASALALVKGYNIALTEKGAGQKMTPETSNLNGKKK